MRKRASKADQESKQSSSLSSRTLNQSSAEPDRRVAVKATLIVSLTKKDGFKDQQRFIALRNVFGAKNTGCAHQVSKMSRGQQL